MNALKRIEATGCVPPDPLVDALAANENFLEGRVALMAKADRDRKEFLGAPWIQFDDEVRRRIARQARREARLQDWRRRFKANAMLFVACVALGVAAALFVYECCGGRL